VAPASPNRRPLPPAGPDPRPAAPAAADAFTATRGCLLTLADCKAQRSALDAEEQPAEDEDGVEVVHFRFTSTQQQRVPGVLWRAAETDPKAPVILMQHGAGSHKADDYLRLPALRWARRPGPWRCRLGWGLCAPTPAAGVGAGP